MICSDHAGFTRRSRGYATWLLLLGLAISLGAAFAYRQHRAEVRRAQQEEQARSEQRAADEAARKASEEQRAAELAETERQRAEESAHRDSVVSGLKMLADKSRRFSDASGVALASGRIALTAPVASMQAIRRDTAEAILAPCLTTARDSLVKGMDESISAYLVFMRNPANAGQALADAHFKASVQEMDNFKQLLELCKA